MNPAQAPEPELLRLLNEEESDRFHRFHFERDRNCFALSHGNVRKILGAYLGQDPASIRFTANRHGKPKLAGATAALHFNLSHSRSAGLFAVAQGFEVGVDIEDIRPIEPSVARNTFSAAEISALQRLEGEAWLKGFYHCWTRKEAIVKAEGVGLGMPLDAFDVSITPESAALLSTRPPLTLRHAWKLHDLPIPRELLCAAHEDLGSVAALATADPQASVTCFTFADDEGY